MKFEEAIKEVQKNPTLYKGIRLPSTRKGCYYELDFGVNSSFKYVTDMPISFHLSPLTPHDCLSISWCLIKIKVKRRKDVQLEGKAIHS